MHECIPNRSLKYMLLKYLYNTVLYKQFTTIIESPTIEIDMRKIQRENR